MPNDSTAQSSTTGQSDSEITVVVAASSPSSSTSQAPGLDTDPPCTSTTAPDKRSSNPHIMSTVHPQIETQQIQVAPTTLSRPVSLAQQQQQLSEPQPDPALVPTLTPAPAAAAAAAPTLPPAPTPTPTPSVPALVPIPAPVPESTSLIPDSKPEEPEEVLGPEAVPQTLPQTFLTFLLVSGRRRTMSFEPETTIARVKELVWNAWPSEWQDERPPTPSYLRILYLGKILQDDDTLTTLSFPKHTPQPGAATAAHATPAATIVHLSIRPYALPTDEDALKKKGRRRRGSRGGGDTDGAGDGGGDADGRGAGCCGGCVIC